MAWLMRIGDQMSDPAKCQCSIARVLGFFREYLSAKLYGLGYVQFLRLERRIDRQRPWPIWYQQIGPVSDDQRWA